MSKMEMRILGRSNLSVSRIGFGVLTMGPSQLNLPVKEGAALIKYAMEAGINFFDTAQYYDTYPYLREALKGSPKDPIIASKCLYDSYEAMKDAIEEARIQLDKDIIDIFLLHEVRSGYDWESRKSAFECLKDAKQKGIVKAIGISTHHVDVMEDIASEPDIDVLFPLINFRGLGIRRGLEIGEKKDMEVAIKRASESGIGVFAMKVLGGGILINEYEKAMRYAMELDGISSVMLGFGEAKEIDTAVLMLEGRLTANYTPDMTRKRIFIDKGDCEGCGACKERCPNHAIAMDEDGLAFINYDLCITCAYCAPVCPVRAIIMLG